MPLSSEPPRRRLCLHGLLFMVAALALMGCARRLPPQATQTLPPASVALQAQPGDEPNLAAKAEPAAFTFPESPPPPALKFKIPAQAQEQPKAQPQPRVASAFRPAPRKPGNPKACRPARPAYDRRGTASWYGHAQHGDATASGEPFDMNALTAAHRTLAFGTRVRVTHLKNGRAVVLTINDRGPFTAGRLIDVSRRAARDLGFLEEDHLAPVRVEAVTGC
ncbi:septal ring lytic transglycosylase RlpA family protein [Shumkonia mesophila]|uniref:septal ring lytic transglycosylase RlpA family protein n=1 Tax=Shumkonia mesophila TaxID=2838854 RepID=UPI002934FA97|nr:septal ring lytic transglycosylase RlpA family protein [Shumkonia mesophila]